MGQRTWTTMIYLNDVEKGGETYFKHLKLKIKPEKGLLIAWNNLFPVMRLCLPSAEINI